MSAEFRELEMVLRRNEASLVDMSAQRFRRVFASEKHLLHLAQTGAKYLHEMMLVSAAVYPSDVSMHSTYTWAMQPTSLLLQRNLGFRHQREILAAYFDSAKETLGHAPHLLNALVALDQKMDYMLRQIYASEFSLGAD